MQILKRELDSQNQILQTGNLDLREKLKITEDALQAMEVRRNEREIEIQKEREHERSVWGQQQKQRQADFDNEKVRITHIAFIM